MTSTATGLQPLEVLFEADGLPAVDLPAELERLYGGGLGFTAPAFFSNFVSSLDGVVAIPSLPQSNKLISRGSEGDRLVMSLLRAFADVIVVGSGTLHGSPAGRWRPDSQDAQVDEELAQLRRALGLVPVPELAILTRSGAIDVNHPALRAGALVVTTDAGETALRDRIPSASTVVSLGNDLDPRRVVTLLHERGHALVLSEAGPTVFGAFLDAGMVDELFLTISPLLVGREGGEDRLQLVEEHSWLSGEVPLGRLLSARRAGSHLLLRYSLR